MPVAKAKGAIFAIYADSPSLPTHSSTSRSTRVSARNSSPTKCPAKPAVRAAPRRALAALQPSGPVGKRGFPSAKSAEGKTDKVLHLPLDDKTRSRPTKPTRPSALSAAPVPPKSTSTSKRPHGLLSPTTPAVPSTPTSGKQLRDRDCARGRGEGSAKRVRSARKAEEGEKENRPVPSTTLDSPAGRTRSKTGVRTHRPADSISTLGDMALVSPHRPRSATVSALAAGGQPGERARHEDVFGLRGVLGVAAREKGGLGQGEKVVGKARKGLGVRPDGPLVDVSEAYGATGEEPAGFREAVLRSKVTTATTTPTN